MDNNVVGNAIRKVREKRGLTQKELGELLGKSHNTISSWESGTTQPSAEYLVTLFKFLAESLDQSFSITSFDELVSEDTSEEGYNPFGQDRAKYMPPSRDGLSIAHIYDQLSKSGRQHLRSTAEILKAKEEAELKL